MIGECANAVAREYAAKRQRRLEVLHAGAVITLPLCIQGSVMAFVHFQRPTATRHLRGRLDFAGIGSQMLASTYQIALGVRYEF